MNRADVMWRRQFAPTALLACALSVSGCARFGYAERVKPSAEPGDAGIDSGANDAGPLPPPGGMGGGGSGGASGAGKAGSGGGSQPIDDDAGHDRDAAQDDSDAGAADGGGISKWCPEQPGVLFCDGFEDPDFSRWSYNVPDNGMAVRTTLPPIRTGSGALHATTGTNGPGGQARWATEALAKQMSGDIWFRFYDFIPSTVTINTHVSIGVVSEIMPPWGGFSLELYPTHVVLNSQNGMFQGTRQFPRDQWVCVELHVHIDPVAGMYEAYLDGTLAARSTTPLNTLPVDGYTSAEIGIHYADANQGPVEVYVDDVMLATTRVPCD